MAAEATRAQIVSGAERFSGSGTVYTLSYNPHIPTLSLLLLTLLVLLHWRLLAFFSLFQKIVSGLKYVNRMAIFKLGLAI